MKPVFQGLSQGRNLGPRLDASPTHDLISEREREGVNPRWEGGEASGIFRVKREGRARGPRAEDSGSPHSRAEASLQVSSLLATGDFQVKGDAPHPG